MGETLAGIYEFHHHFPYSHVCHSPASVKVIVFRAWPQAADKLAPGAAAHRVQLAIRERALIFERGGPRSVVGLAHDLLHQVKIRRKCVETVNTPPETCASSFSTSARDANSSSRNSRSCVVQASFEVSLVVLRMIFSVQSSANHPSAALAQRCRRSCEPAVGDRAPMHRVTSPSRSTKPPGQHPQSRVCPRSRLRHPLPWCCGRGRRMGSTLRRLPRGRGPCP
jgi:hypothetical protein